MDIFDDWDNRELLIYFQSLISRCLKDPDRKAPEKIGETIADQLWLMNAQLGSRLHSLVGSDVHTEVFGRLWLKYLVCFQRLLKDRQESLKQSLHEIEMLEKAVIAEMDVTSTISTNRGEQLHERLLSAAD